MANWLLLYVVAVFKKRVEFGSFYVVGKTFVLTALTTTNKTNDAIVSSTLSASPEGVLVPQGDKRRMHGNHKSCNKEKIKEHIESVNPCICHYRRSHAPHRQYLPSDATIADMWKDFNVKYPTAMCSYSVYRGIVSDDMNIVFYGIGW